MGVKRSACETQRNECGGFSELHDAALGSAIGRNARDRHLCVDGGHIDDSAFDPLRDHGLGRALNCLEGSREIDVDDRLELIERGLQERGGVRDARVIHENRGRTDLSFDLVEQRVDLLLTPHVAGDADRAVPQGFRCFGHAIGVDISQHNAGTGFANRHGTSVADAWAPPVMMAIGVSVIISLPFSWNSCVRSMGLN